MRARVGAIASTCSTECGVVVPFAFGACIDGREAPVPREKHANSTGSKKTRESATAPDATRISIIKRRLLSERSCQATVACAGLSQIERGRVRTWPPLALNGKRSCRAARGGTLQERSLLGSRTLCRRLAVPIANRLVARSSNGCDVGSTHSIEPGRRSVRSERGVGQMPCNFCRIGDAVNNSPREVMVSPVRGCHAVSECVSRTWRRSMSMPSLRFALAARVDNRSSRMHR